jgi:nicotinamidase-related amidase
MPATALLVIDAQESFRHRPYWLPSEAAAFFPSLNRAIEGARERHIPIVRVLHVEPQGAFSIASGLVKPMQELAGFTPAAEFHKSRHSALVGTGLETWLIQNGIRRVIVTGVRTEQCCETTARHASDLGFEVDYVTEATLTFDMIHAPSQVRVSADDLKLRTELVLAGRFATICSVDEALRRAG